MLSASGLSHLFTTALTILTMAANSSDNLLLMTCASGKQGTALVPLLYPHWRLRLQVNSARSKERLQSQYPRAEIVQANLEDATSAAQLFTNVTVAYIIVPAMTRNETRMATHVFDAAQVSYKKGTLKHLVYSSVLHSCLRKLINHDSKRYAEEYLIESGVPFTIMQPTHVMENLPLAKFLIEDEPKYTLPYNPATKFSWVSTRDVAAAAVKVLEEREKHFYASYPLVGTEPGSYEDVVRWVSEAIGKTVTVTALNPLDGAEMYLSMMGGGSGGREVLRRLLVYYDERGLVGNKNVLTWLLGRQPLSYQDWLALGVNEWKEKQ